MNSKDRKKFEYIVGQVVKKDKNVLTKIGLMGRKKNR